MDPWIVLPALVVLAVVFVVAPVGAVTFAHWRRPWRLTCPRTGTEAQIQVGATRAAVAAVLGRGEPSIERCSLRPRVLDCREACLALPAGELRRMRRGEAPPRTSAPGLHTILVPLDGSPGSESVLDAVGELARAHRASVRFVRVRFVHVVEPVGAVRSDDGARVLAFVDHERETRVYFDRLAGCLPGVTVEGTIRFGDPVAEIVEEAEAAGADLIALASHRRHALGRLVRGSLARRLERATTIPLLLFPYGERAAA